MLNNKKNRTENVKRSSAVAVIDNITAVILPFVYRTLFLRILTGNYLGLGELFTSILGMLSLADLGIGTALNFRLYQPVNEHDIPQVGRLMHYYRSLYRKILLLILGLGLCLMPFLPYLINSTAEIPADVNLYVIYALYLLQTASSYMFAYKQSLLSADQRHHLVLWLHIMTLFMTYGVQSIILFVFRDFTVTLAVGIAANLLLNFLFSLYVTREYPEVFAVRESISAEEKALLRQDAGATMAHRLGGFILGSTDNIILSRFAGLFVVGIYSNYKLITGGISGLVGKVFSSIVPSVGNAHFDLDRDAAYVVYKRLLFLNFWAGSVATIGTYALINPFISLWLGDAFLFTKLTVLLLCIQLYLEITRQANLIYTNACGLYVKDRLRPFIESAINLVVSIVLVLQIGVPGIFLGTIASHFATIFWREPLILYRYEFRRSARDYWKLFFLFTLFTAVLCAAADRICSQYAVGIIRWLLCGVGIVLVSNVLLIALFHHTDEYQYFKNLIIQSWHQLKGKYTHER